jgi:hypothetical protein
MPFYPPTFLNSLSLQTRFSSLSFPFFSFQNLSFLLPFRRYSSCFSFSFWVAKAAGEGKGGSQKLTQEKQQ